MCFRYLCQILDGCSYMYPTMGLLFCSIDLHVCIYSSTMVFLLLQLCILLERWYGNSASIVHYAQNFLFTIWESLGFHMNYRIFFSISLKAKGKFWIGLHWTCKMGFVEKKYCIMLILSIYEHRSFLCYTYLCLS